MTRLAAARRFLGRQDGQTLPMVVLWLTVLFGMAAIVIDIGRLYAAHQQLQKAVSAAALVAGEDLPNAKNAYNAAIAYSGAQGENNALTGYGVSGGQPSSVQVTFECNSHGQNYTPGSTPTCQTDTSNTKCHPNGSQSPTPTGVTTCNVVKVTENATVNLTFGIPFLPSWTISSSAIASARGGYEHPMHAFVILDNTDSMTQSCSSTVSANGNPSTDTSSISSPQKIDCAKAGVRALLQALWPCSEMQPTCGSATANSNGQLGANVASPDDEVGLMVIPAINGNPPGSSTLNEEIDCTKGDSFSTTYPTYTPYTYSSSQTDGGIPTSDDYSGYEAVGLSSDYKNAYNSSSLNWTSSALVKAVDWGQCKNSKYPGGNYYGLKVIGGQGSYLAGAITEAQHLLDQNAVSGTENVIIVESDGQLNNPKTFTDKNPCESAINAATQAKAAGTLIYTIAYGSNGTQCPDTSYNLTDLQTMSGIASNATTFFDSPTTGDLTTDFQQVGESLTDPKLIPDCSVAPPGC